MGEPFHIRDKEKLKTILLNRLHRVFPQLKNIEAEILWGGRINCSENLMPMIGKDSDGVWYSTGFGGHGVVPTTMAGFSFVILISDRSDLKKCDRELIASAIAEGDERWYIFHEEYPLVSVGWRFSRFLTFLHLKWANLCDSIYCWIYKN